MNQNLTEIVMVVDRSGSMQVIQSDAEGGVNSFIEKQKAEPGEANLTIVQFDHHYEFVCKGVPIRKAPVYKLEPRGSTALYDAVCRAIIETGERLKDMAEDERPGLVVFVITTDGLNNDSRDFTIEDVRAKIKHQTDVYKWQFTFLGANFDVNEVVKDMEIKTSGGLKFAATPAGTKAAYAAASSNVGRMRQATAKGLSVQNSYTDEEREASNQ